MRIVFMGTPVFASLSLERLYHDWGDVVAVITQPDKPRNRGMKVSYSPVKQLAMTHGTQIYQPATLKDSSVVDIIRKLSCDIIVVVAYGRLLPRVILDLPPYGCINIHASLLPKYRGAAPIQWAILSGETETGVTSMYMTDELDAGDVIYRKKIPIGENETSGELHDRMSVAGAELLNETLAGISRGTAARLPQVHAEASYAPPLEKGISPIDWTDSALNIKRKVRALNPWPVATAKFDERVYKIFSVDIVEKKAGVLSPGEIVSAGQHGIEVDCSDAAEIIKELQAPGGKRMAACEYLKGHKELLSRDGG